jgi:integrase
MKGHIQKRKGARGVSYRVFVELPRDEDGRRRQFSCTCATRKEAERELARLLRELDTGQWADPATLTFGEYLQRWLVDAARQKVGARTYERYEAIMRLHVAPVLGTLPLAKLRPLHLQRLYSQLQEGGMSAAGVSKVHARLHSALRQAVRWQMLPYNPADGVESPKAQRSEVRALTEAETARLLSAAEGSRLHAPLALAVSTGMRRGELLGLRWRDVDLEGSALSVAQALEETRAGVAPKAPKTAHSRRRVALPPSAVAVLREHRKAHAAERLLRGSDYEDNNLVFPAPDGSPWRPSAFSMAFMRMVRAAGLPPMRLHDLRHTHASQLMRAGVNPKVVQERLGHASIGITLDLYSHVLPGMQEEAAQRWDAAMSAALAASQEGGFQSAVTKWRPTEDLEGGAVPEDE